jgi:pilus assembly protein Flp/PilA
MFARLRSVARHFRKDESGATAIEYGLIAALFVVAIISGVIYTGNQTNGLYSYIRNNVEPALQNSN